MLVDYLFQLITDGILCAVIATLLIIDLIILITWVTVDPLSIIASQLTPIVSYTYVLFHYTLYIVLGI